MTMQKKIILFVTVLVFLVVSVVIPYLFNNEKAGAFLSGFFMGLTITVLVLLVFSKSKNISGVNENK